MRSAFLAASLVWTLAAYAQTAPKPAITVDELMEKSIAASGGREAMLKMTSLVATGSMEIVAMGATASVERYQKAPDKSFNLTNVEGYGEVKQGFDGKVAWSSEPQNGLVEMTGDMAAAAKRDAQFHGELHWKELYPKTEITGKEKVGERDCYVVKLTPTEGKPLTRWYDAETFLVAKVLTVADSPQGSAEIAVELSDYKDAGNGVKVPYTMKMTMPGIGDLVTHYKEFKFNVDIDDAKFAKPKN